MKLATTTTGKRTEGEGEGGEEGGVKIETGTEDTGWVGG